jgi:hypothetical protein
LAEIGCLRDLLEQSGIACTVKNEQLAGALGEIPPLECLPELWVLDDRALPQALEIVAEATRPAPPGKAWRCRNCGEHNDGEFAACWRCGHADESS